MIAIRLVKVALVASTALFALLVAVDNVVDYDTNYAFVRHTLSMDTTFPDNVLKARAITTPALWTLAYWLIIATEAAVGLLLAGGAFRLGAAPRPPRAAVHPPPPPGALAAAPGFPPLVNRRVGGGRGMVRHVAVQDLERPAGGLSLLHDAARGADLRQPDRRWRDFPTMTSDGR